MAKKTHKESAEGYQLFKQELRQDSFGRMYILHGEESYLVESCRNVLKKKLVSGFAEDFNYHRFNAESWSIEAFQEAVEAIPMMSETSMVEVSDVNFFGFPEDERNLMTEIFSDIPDYCTIVFVYSGEWKPDKRIKKLYAAMEAVCKVFELNKQPEYELIPWIRRQLAREKKTISDELCRYLLLQTGGSMTGIAAEISKLLAYTDQPQICKKDIDDVVIRSTKKNKGTADARQVAMYLIRQLTNLSFPDIGKEFARDHTTVMHAVKKVEGSLKSGDANLQNAIRDITANINSCL